MTIRKVRSTEWVEDETGSTLAARDHKDSGDLVVEHPAVMLHVRGGVDRDRHGKLAGKGPLLSYELSAKACAGILRRASKRGKQLPEALMQALEARASPNLPEQSGRSSEEGRT